MYEKPMVVESEDLAEGIFAASGDHQAAAPAPADEKSCSFTKKNVVSWGGTEGQVVYDVSLPATSDAHTTFEVTFSEPVVNAWGFGSWALSADKKSAAIDLWNISGVQECTLQGPTTVEITSFVRTN